MIRFAIYFVLIALTSSLHATLIIYEPFDYVPTGSQITNKNGGTGFGGNSWAGSATYDVIRAGSLSSGALRTQGNSLLIGDGTSNGSYATRDFPKIDGITNETTWLSSLFQMSATSSSGLTSSDVGYFAVRASSSVGVRFGVFSDPENEGRLTLGLATYSGGVTTYSFSRILFQPTVIYNLVASITWEALTAKESIYLYINPDENEVLSPASADAFGQVHLGLSSGTQRLNGLEVTGGAHGTQWVFDEIRIGQTLTDVMPIPEPRALVMVFFGFVTFLWKNRSRFQSF